MPPHHMVVRRSNCTYLLLRSQTSSTLASSETRMIMPPIVGVPFFSICPARPRSRMVSPICLRCSQWMMCLPKKNDISMLTTIASIALKER